MIRLALIAGAALALAVSPAAAKPGNGNGHGNGQGVHGDNGIGNDAGFTPPGLAKKPYGMPPGQAKKLYRRGQYLPSAYYANSANIVLEPSRYNLSPAPYGYRWVRADGRYYLIQRRTGLISQLVEGLVR